MMEPPTDPPSLCEDERRDLQAATIIVEGAKRAIQAVSKRPENESWADCIIRCAGEGAELAAMRAAWRLPRPR